jgi:hypothetical protein
VTGRGVGGPVSCAGSGDVEGIAIVNPDVSV